MKLLTGIFAAFLILTSAASATTVPFFMVVTSAADNGGQTFGVNNGDVLNGELSFDETGIDLMGDFTVDLANDLMISFGPYSFATTADAMGNPSASFVAGVLTQIDYFFDNQTYVFDVRRLSWDYENGDPNDPDNPLAGASGFITLQDPNQMSAVPLPGALVFFATGLAAAIGLRRRKI